MNSSCAAFGDSGGSGSWPRAAAEFLQDGRGVGPFEQVDAGHVVLLHEGHIEQPHEIGGIPVEIFADQDHGLELGSVALPE
jgi:hypothetical protein